MSTSIKQALAQATDLQQVSESWRLDAELLLAETLGVSREYLHTWSERPLDAAAQEQYRAQLARRSQGEPIAYILGRREFWDFLLQVTPAVLIPRPETELLVETALEIARSLASTALRIVDLGTGSGAIALALARELPASRVTAVDRSTAALAVAQTNAATLAVTNIDFLASSWCEQLPADCYDVVVANPPYVAEGDPHLQRGDLRFEPAMALVAPDAGLADIKQIVDQSRSVLRRDGWLLIEHGYTQGDAVHEIFQSRGFRNVECRKDYAGLDRLTIGQWSPPGVA